MIMSSSQNNQFYKNNINFLNPQVLKFNFSLIEPKQITRIVSLIKKKWFLLKFLLKNRNLKYMESLMVFKL